MSDKEEGQEVPGSPRAVPGEETCCIVRLSVPSGDPTVLPAWAKHPGLWLIAVEVTPVFGGSHFNQERKKFLK